jgi:hypothetical protein
MSAEDSRRFGIADGLIVIAGAAAGLGVLRSLAPGISPQRIWNAFVRPTQSWSLEYASALIAEVGIFLGIPFLVGWSPSLLIMQVVRRRSPWRRLRRQPGFVASLIATAAIALSVCTTSAAVWLSIPVPRRFATDFSFAQPCVVGGVLAGSGVLSSWSTMWLFRVWRPRRTWTDRLGRLTGATWILVGAMSAVFLLLNI